MKTIISEHVVSPVDVHVKTSFLFEYDERHDDEKKNYLKVTEISLYTFIFFLPFEINRLEVRLSTVKFDPWNILTTNFAW